MFLRAAAKFETLATFDARKQMGSEMMKQFFGPDSPNPVSIGRRTKKKLEIASQAGEWQQDIFANVIAENRKILIFDLYPRFIGHFYDEKK